MARLDYAELNSTIRYTMWSVFRIEPGRLGEDRAAVATETTEFLDALAEQGRGRARRLRPRRACAPTPTT